LWHRIASRRNCFIQEAQQHTTSTEFVELCVLLDEEWHEQTKLDFYLAQIAAEIRVIREGFSKEPKGVSVNDLIINFDPEGTRKKRYIEVDDVSTEEKRKEYVPGPDLVKDPKWAKVNENAKLCWGARLAGKRKD
jgi:hypothetical protein